MASESSNTPPSSSKSKTNEDQLKLIKIWRKFIELPVLEIVLEIARAAISRDNGVDAIIERLNSLFKKDSTITKDQFYRHLKHLNPQCQYKHSQVNSIKDNSK